MSVAKAGDVEAAVWNAVATCYSDTPPSAQAPQALHKVVPAHPVQQGAGVTGYGGVHAMLELSIPSMSSQRIESSTGGREPRGREPDLPMAKSGQSQELESPLLSLLHLPLVSSLGRPGAH